MENVDELLEKARAAAAPKALPYAGALTPPEAYAVLSNAPNATLVDVRTEAEWNWVGSVPGAVQIEWNTWPAGQRNPGFVDALRQAVPDKDAPVLFICRSGARSHAAATLAASHGYSNAFNVLEGFEGDKNAQGQRNTVGGWRHHQLPWHQS